MMDEVEEEAEEVMQEAAGQAEAVKDVDRGKS
jgi:hypothetical protein